MEFTIATCLLALSCYRMYRFSWKAGKYCCRPEALEVKLCHIIKMYTKRGTGQERVKEMEK